MSTVAGVALLALVASGCSSASSADDDRELAYCLSSAQQTRLTEAAAALGIVAPGKLRGTVQVDGADIGLAAWRAKNADAQKGFERACAAIAPQAGPDELVTGLLSVGNVLAGGVVALASTAWTARTTRRRQVASAVREAVRRLARSVENLKQQRADRTYTPATGDAVADRIAVLDVALRTAEVLTRANTAAPTYEALDDLSRRLTVAWPGWSSEQLDAHIASLDSAVKDVRAKSDDVADTLDRPWWRRRP